MIPTEGITLTTTSTKLTQGTEMQRASAITRHRSSTQHFQGVKTGLGAIFTQLSCDRIALANIVPRNWAIQARCHAVNRLQKRVSNHG